MIDTHAHLDQIKNIEGVLARADAAGVKAIFAMSVDLASCRRNFELADQFSSPRLFLGMGIHPGEVKMDESPECLQFMRDNADKISIVGEIGLDFWYPWARKDDTKKNEQRQVFRAMLDFAVEHQLPVSVHSRGKWEECFQTVKDAGVRRAVFHWYSGPTDVLEKILTAGYFVSFTPSLAYSPESQRVALATPVEQALVETDCPVFYRDRSTGEGFPSEPKDVFRTLELFCRLKNLEPAPTATILNDNASRLLGIKGNIF